MSRETIQALDALVFYGVILLIMLAGLGIWKLIALVMEVYFNGR